MSTKSDNFIILGFAASVFFFIFLAIRVAVVKSIQTIPAPDRSAYLRTLEQQKRTQEQIDDSHAAMMEQTQTRIEDLQNMRENTGYAPEDVQQKQKDYMRAQQQRMKDMQRLNNR